MATQKYTTLGQGSLGSNYTAGATSLVLQSGQGATFPSSGDFVVAVDDPPAFFLKCTARSGDTLTVATSAVDSTTAANKSTGVTVTEVITATVLDGIRGDMHQTGTAAARPGAEKNGNLYLPSDGLQLSRDTGSAYASWGPLFPLVEPDNSVFSWVNQGTASIDTTHGGILLADTAGGTENIRARVKSRPSSPPWTVTIGFIPNITTASFHFVGICVRESSSGKITILGPSYGGTDIIRWSDTATMTSWSNGGTMNWPRQGLTFLRVKDDGTNLIFSVSNDGLQFCTVRTMGRTSYMTGGADQVGFFVHCENATFPVSLALLSWREA